MLTQSHTLIDPSASAISSCAGMPAYTFTVATKTLLTVDEYLSLPETKPASEFADGQLVQKPMPSLKHGMLANEIGALLRESLRPRRRGVVAVEVRFLDRPSARAYIPDVSVLLSDRVPEAALAGGAVELPPDLAIEILSPDDRAGDVLEKIAFYRSIGVSLVWIIDPDQETLTACRRDGTVSVHRAAEVIDARPVLEGFQLDLATLFAATRPERR